MTTRLTRAGWLALVGAAGIVFAGRLFGIQEFTIGGLVMAAVVVAAFVKLAFTRPHLSVRRVVSPSVVQAGSPVRIDLRVSNTGSHGLPVVYLTDPVTATRGAALATSPLDAGSQTIAAYRMPTTRRGRIEIGPLRAVITDPFGVAVRRWAAAEISDLIVLPRIDDIPPVPLTAGRDPNAGMVTRHSLGRSGGDFYALRDYQSGDDLRRVHWAASARHDELVVRQDEAPWQGRTTVVLDTRHAATTAEAFEFAVSAAASILSAGSRRHDLIRLVTTEGSDSGFGSARAHTDALMEFLAIVNRSPAGDLRRTLAVLRSNRPAGALVAIVGDIPAVEFTDLSRLGDSFGSVTAVHFMRSEKSTNNVANLGRLRVVPVATSDVFADRWRASWTRSVSGAAS